MRANTVLFTTCCSIVGVEVEIVLFIVGLEHFCFVVVYMLKQLFISVSVNRAGFSPLFTPASVNNYSNQGLGIALDIT